MQQQLANLSILVVLTVSSLFGRAQGIIVPNGVSSGGLDQFGYKINVLHDPSASNPLYSTNTQFWLNPLGLPQPSGITNTFSFTELADIGVRVFLVSANNPVSLEAIQGQNYTELVSGHNYVFDSGKTFYLGLYSGASLGPPYPPNPPYTYTDPVFGWAKMLNYHGVMQLLYGALGYKCVGIYTGTQSLIPVPEPGTAAFIALGLGSTFFFRKRGSTTLSS